jgi:hypothetical protein
VMVSIIDQVIVDEHRGLLTMINLTQEQLEEIGSDKLPSFPWDPGVQQEISLQDDPDCTREPHTPPWVGLE